jgi:hypothetical protein
MSNRSPSPAPLQRAPRRASELNWEKSAHSLDTRLAVLAATLAAVATLAYFGLWLEVLSELGLPKS